MAGRAGTAQADGLRTLALRLAKSVAELHGEIATLAVRVQHLEAIIAAVAETAGEQRPLEGPSRASEGAAAPAVPVVTSGA